jgi:hypothetical protein
VAGIKDIDESDCKMKVADEPQFNRGIEASENN